MLPMAGATFAAVQLNVWVAAVCSPSLASTVTVPDASSVVVLLHENVPSPVLRTTPSPDTCLMVRVPSPSLSENEPEVVGLPGEPSLPRASDAWTFTAGAYELVSQASPRPSSSA